MQSDTCEVVVRVVRVVCVVRVVRVVRVVCGAFDVCDTIVGVMRV
jgi:hypothetical protein